MLRFPYVPAIGSTFMILGLPLSAVNLNNSYFYSVPASATIGILLWNTISISF
jgi:hypothetical protein